MTEQRNQHVSTDSQGALVFNRHLRIVIHAVVRVVNLSILPLVIAGMPKIAEDSES